MLPAPLRGAATLLAVLALAALLTTVRHNASAYLTGVWDTGSQTLVYGRIHMNFRFFQHPLPSVHCAFLTISLPFPRST